MRKAFIAAIVALGIVSAAPQAFADGRQCRGTIGAVTVDSIIVPEGAFCTLDGTRVRGNVDVQADATLVATGVTVGGNVSGDEAAAVTISGAAVRANVQLTDGGMASLADSRVRGNAVFAGNVGAVDASRNTILGSLQADKNTGGVTIADNRIGNNLQCSENDPAPTGGGNMVRGSKSDQCAEL